MRSSLKIFIILLILIFPCLSWGLPYLACDPYLPIGSETITDVEVQYSLPGETSVTVTGTYTVYGSYIILLNFASYPTYIQNLNYFRARWQSSEGYWSGWSTFSQFIFIGN